MIEALEFIFVSPLRFAGFALLLWIASRWRPVAITIDRGEE